MEKLNVQLTREHLFDFLLYHTFSKASGFLVNMLGMCLIVLGAVMQMVGAAYRAEQCKADPVREGRLSV